MKKKYNVNKKYRVKLSSGRIVGPFDAGQIGELYEKGHISGSELCQMFPGGDWRKVKDFSPITTAIKQIISKQKSAEELQENTTVDTLARMNLVKKLKSVKDEQEDEPAEQKMEEFKFSKEGEGSAEVNYDELEKKYEEKKAELDEREEEPEIEEDAGVEKTVVLRRPVTEDIEKTRVLRPLEPILEDNEGEEEEQVEEEEEEEEVEDQIDTNEATVVANLNELLPAVKKRINCSRKRVQKKNISGFRSNE